MWFRARRNVGTIIPGVVTGAVRVRVEIIARVIG
jgi:hypothetical protein